MQIIPLNHNEEKKDLNPRSDINYEYEPSEEEILEKIIPNNIAIQIFTKRIP